MPALSSVFRVPQVQNEAGRSMPAPPASGLGAAPTQRSARISGSSPAECAFTSAHLMPAGAGGCDVRGKPSLIPSLTALRMHKYDNHQSSRSERTPTTTCVSSASHMALSNSMTMVCSGIEEGRMLGVAGGVPDLGCDRSMPALLAPGRGAAPLSLAQRRQLESLALVARASAKARAAWWAERCA